MNTSINAEETSIRRLAAVLSLLIHGLLLAAMVTMVDWKSVHVAPAMMEVTVWDSLPAKSAPNAPEVPTPPPEPEPEPVAQAEPPEPAAAEAEAEAAEIALKKQEQARKQEAEKLKEERLKEEKRKAQLKKLQDELNKQEVADKLKKIQDALRQQELETQASAGEPDPSVLAFFVQKMRIKIRSNLIQSLCPANNPELIIEMRLTPAGEIAGSPKLAKTSGDSVCDDAVIRAILGSRPFELPADIPAKNKFLDTIRLKFKPHD